MATANLNVRVDETVKKNAEQLLEELGLNMSTAINIFLRQMLRVHGLPFEVTTDAFYTEGNIRYLEQKMADYKAGKLDFSEHPLIEE